MKKFEFTEATPLIQFIEKHREKIIGQRIRGVYCNMYFNPEMLDLSTDEPIAFLLDDYDIIIKYLFLSNMTVYVAESGSVKKDASLNFLYKDVPGSQNVRHYLNEETFPYAGCKIQDITVMPFSKAFEINPSTGEMRPDGGDYFSRITIHLDNGERLFLCAAPSICDGYLDVWFDW